MKENLENMVVTQTTSHTSTLTNSIKKALSEMDMLDESSDADSDFEFDILTHYFQIVFAVLHKNEL